MTKHRLPRMLCWYLLATLIMVTMVGCCTTKTRPPASSRYPYHASAEREATIRTGFSKVQVGMSMDQVHAILGSPDEVTPLYEPMIPDGKQTGFSHWYLVQRMAESGSVVERNEKLVVVRTDLDIRVVEVQHWGF